MKFTYSNSSHAFESGNSEFGNIIYAFSKIFSQQRITTTIRYTKMGQATTYPFETKIASRGHHVYRITTWVNVKEGDEGQVEIETNKDSIKVDLYACAIRVQDKDFDFDIYVSSLRKKKAESLERFFLLSIGRHQYRQEAWKSH